jgi:uncharacterized damage-inducible protein DinB
MKIPVPSPGEYHPFQKAYIDRVPADADFLALMSGQPARLRAQVAGLSDAQASTPHTAGEWTIKQVLSHINDTERILAYRALRLSRGDATPLPGFEQDDYEATANANARTVADLLDEYDLIRAATLPFVSRVEPARLAFTVAISNGPVSLRTLVYILAGHVELHMASLQENYGLAAR